LTSEGGKADGLVEGELVREGRARMQHSLERRARLTFRLLGLAFITGAVLCAVFLHQGPRFSVPVALLYVAVYAGVSRVEFEIGTGAAIPTELVLVPMLFVLPVGDVPALVAAALVIAGLLDHSRPITIDRVAIQLTSASQTFGPVLVLGLVGGDPVRMHDWPIYVAALAAQFAFDFAVAGTGSTLGHGVSLRTLLQFLRWVFAVDAALAPAGLAIAFAASASSVAVLFSLPLVGLLLHFSRERRRRIDHALELSDAYRGTAFLLGDVVEADDAYTGSHSRHVVDLVLGVCDRLGLDPEARRDSEFVALLHDVGKIRIPHEIIQKPGPLDADERALMETHTIVGQELLERVGGLLGHIGRVVRSCHEHWDCGGYPDGLVGDEIPLIARIVCACDALSAMTTDRSYRKARSSAEALTELQRCAGTQFDPQVVAAIVAVSR
jgi:HD-GYP domain-containing protein (c-di-GMP phosphodiesterase class II)